MTIQELIDKGQHHWSKLEEKAIKKLIKGYTHWAINEILSQAEFDTNTNMYHNLDNIKVEEIMKNTK